MSLYLQADHEQEEEEEDHKNKNKKTRKTRKTQIKHIVQEAQEQHEADGEQGCVEDDQLRKARRLLLYPLHADTETSKNLIEIVFQKKQMRQNRGDQKHHARHYTQGFWSIIKHHNE